MAEEKVKTKKWIIIVSIIILLAVGVTLAIVLWPKNPQVVMDKTIRESKEMFLVQEESKSDYETYTLKFYGNTTLNKEFGKDIELVQELSGDLSMVISFYSRFVLYAQNNDTMQGNYNQIVSGFDNASAKQRQIEQEIKDVNAVDLSIIDVSFLSDSWKRVRGYYVDYVKDLAQAADGLSKVFVDCLPKGVAVNDFSYDVLSGVNAYLVSIIKDLEEGLTKAENKIKYFTKFVNYLNVDMPYCLINRYAFESSLQEKTKMVGRFIKLYNKISFKGLIDTIGKNGITYNEAILNDSGGLVLKETKNFLEGGFEV